MPDMPHDVSQLVIGGRSWAVYAPQNAADLIGWLDRNGDDGGQDPAPAPDAAEAAVVIGPDAPGVLDVVALAAVRGIPLLLSAPPSSPDTVRVIENDLAVHGCHVAPDLAAPLLIAARHLARSAAPRLDLSDRERAILELVAQGESNRFIAAQLFLSEHTVRNHLSRMFRKLGVSTRGEAAQALRDEGAPASARRGELPGDGSAEGRKH